MVELSLLLIGTGLIRRKWWVVGLFGLVWLTLGIFFFVDALVDEIRIPPGFFAIPVLVDASVSGIAALLGRRERMPIRLVKAALFIGIALLLVDAPWHSDMFIGLLVGTFLIADAAWRTASAFIVRYARWHFSIFKAAIEFLLGLWSLVPWPTQWRGEVGADVGTLLIISAIGVCAIALRIRNMPPGTSMSVLLTRGWPEPSLALKPRTSVPTPSAWQTAPVTVHVWTPTGDLVALNRGISRYVVASDEKGAISTGHAALELAPDLYISHYPAVEIERSQAEFSRILRATDDNDVPGRFLPSYQEERADWCDSTLQVRLLGLNAPALREFWTAYRVDTTYNLTDRNCSSAVAKALDAGIEGIFESRAYSPLFILKLLFTPELWIAGVMRRRAFAMAWTPGIVLDYARALSHIVELAEHRA
jgi:uncharacterized membrane protein HdeD (DUF308 family)